MTGLLLRLRAELRRRWAAWVALTLIVGVGGGLVIALVAGARRTTDAYPTFVREQHAADVLVAGQSDFGLIGSVDLADVAALPDVDFTSNAEASLLFAGNTNTGREIGPVDVFPVIPLDDRLGRSIERWKIEEGRRADPTKLDEATASFELAERLHLKVGSTVRIHFVKAESFLPVAAQLLAQFGPRLRGEPGAEASSIERLADGADVTFKVVGIEASPAEFPPLGPDLSPTLHLTRAFADAYRGQLVTSPIMWVKLKPGADLTSFTKEVERLAPGNPVSFIVSREFQTPKVQRSIDVVATALLVFAGLLAVALGLVVAQALVRQAFLEAGDDRILRGLGMTRVQVGSLVVVRGALIACGGAVLAIVVAYACSPLFPTGLARRAELDGGLHLDGFVVGVGIVALILVVVALSVLAAWRVARAQGASDERTRPTMVDRFVSNPSVSPPVGMGMRFALDPGRGSRAVPVWTAFVGASMAVALLAGTWTFRAGLDNLLASPHLYGWNWTIKSGAPSLPELGPTLNPVFDADPNVQGFAAGTVTQVKIGSLRTDVLAVDQLKGSVTPTIVKGRMPTAPDELLLGSKILEDLDLRVGDRTSMRIGDVTIPLTVTGEAVFPEYGDKGRLGNGALLTYEALERLLPTARQNTFLIRFRSGADEQAEVVTFRDALQPVPTRESGRPRDLEDLSNVQDFPTILALLLALLAFACLAHVLVTSVRNHRRELALLRTVGFTRRQLGLTVMWQTTAITVIALAVGLPLGVLGGQWVWNEFVTDLGAVAVSPVPLAEVLLTVPVALLAAYLIAILPAMAAARTHPAVALKAE